MFSIAFGIAIRLEVKYCNTQKQYFLTNCTMLLIAARQ